MNHHTHEAQQRIRIRAVSPGGSVRVETRGGEAGSLTVTLLPGSLREHTESSLAHEVERLIRSGLEASRRATEILREMGGPDDTVDGDAPRAVSTVERRGRSPHWVTAVRRDGPGVSLGILPGAFATLTETQLAGEIESALSGLVADFALSG